MGIDARDFSDFQRRLRRFETELKGMEERAVKAGAQIIKDTTLKTAKSSGYPSLVLENYGSRGGKLGVGYDLVPSPGSGYRALIRARGPWQLGVERDIVNPRGGPSKKTGTTRKGRMARAAAARGGSRRVSFKGAVATPQGLRSYTYVTKRIPGKRAWTRGVEAAQPKVRKAFEDEFARPYRRLFGG